MNNIIEIKNKLLCLIECIEYIYIYENNKKNKTDKKKLNYYINRIKKSILLLNKIDEVNLNEKIKIINLLLIEFIEMHYINILLKKRIKKGYEIDITKTLLNDIKKYIYNFQHDDLNSLIIHIDDIINKRKIYNYIY